MVATPQWGDRLSMGEQQRLGFASLLYHRPMFAIMDESTSALDVNLEEKCMKLCMERGIGCISVGHRPTLQAYHKYILQLEGTTGQTTFRNSRWFQEDPSC